MGDPSLNFKLKMEELKWPKKWRSKWRTKWRNDKNSVLNKMA